MATTITYSGTPAFFTFTWTPILKGATNDPSAATYSKQVGTGCIIGNMCYFTINIVTTSITKSTLTDALRVSLPYAAATLADDVARVSAAVYNATPVQTGNQGRIPSGQSYVEIWQQSLVAAGAALTYALVTGIGVLTNQINIEISGSYRVAM